MDEVATLIGNGRLLESAVHRLQFGIIVVDPNRKVGHRSAGKDILQTGDALVERQNNAAVDGGTTTLHTGSRRGHCSRSDPVWSRCVRLRAGPENPRTRPSYPPCLKPWTWGVRSKEDGADHHHDRTVNAPPVWARCFGRRSASPRPKRKPRCSWDRACVHRTPQINLGSPSAQSAPG